MRAKERNVALICLDSVREDVFRKYARNLQEKADIKYTGCRAVSSWSVPSHASMFTGKLPHQHGIHQYNQYLGSLEVEGTFLNEMPNHRKIGISANVYASSAYGFDKLFDAFIDIDAARNPRGLTIQEYGEGRDMFGFSKYLGYLKESLSHDYPMASIGNGIFSQLKNWSNSKSIPQIVDDGAKVIARETQYITDNEPYFLFANFMDAHWPLTPVRGFNHAIHNAPYDWSSEDYLPNGDRVDNVEDQSLSQYQSLYAASIEYLDRVVSELIDDLLSQSDHPTTIIITSDHGDNLGKTTDNNLLGHKASMTEGLLHVPLLIISPPPSKSGEPVQVDGLVSHTDLSDLVIGLTDGEVADLRRNSVAGERIGSNLPARVNEDSEEADWWKRLIRVVYENDRKYQWDSTGERYVYECDSEQVNHQALIGDEFEFEKLDSKWFSTPIGEYARQSSQNSGSHKISNTTKDRLERLGYR